MQELSIFENIEKRLLKWLFDFCLIHRIMEWISGGHGSELLVIH